MEQRLIDANLLVKEFDDMGQDIDVLDVLLIIERQKTVNAVPAAYCQFKKNASGVNRYCTKCGAYLEDREYENHTIKFCYYCGSRVVLEREKENGTAK